MKKVIIGIHGLGNKPTKFLLEHWWKKSIHEGLERLDRSRFKINFEMVYWADILYPRPLKPLIRDKSHPLYLDERYRPRQGFSPKATSKIRTKILNYIAGQLDHVFLNPDMTLNFARVTDKIIARYFKDLETYYASESIIESDGGGPAREAIRSRLAGVLKKHQKKDILLIAHSMGSIIAYDVLTQTAPDIQIQTLVTIGSPLGLPIIVSRIFFEQKKTQNTLARLKVPENVSKRWYNLSDVEDKVALDQTLADDYAANSQGIGTTDMEVHNDYNMDGICNPHKSFGYLRTPEISRIIDTFLGEKEASWIVTQYRALKNWIASKLNV